MADILRTETNGKLIITLPDKMITSIYDTIVYHITDEGLMCIDRRDSVGFEKAEKQHKAMVFRHQEQEPHACARCGREDYLPTYSRVFQDYYCPSCLAFELEACR